MKRKRAYLLVLFFISSLYVCSSSDYFSRSKTEWLDRILNNTGRKWKFICVCRVHTRNQSRTKPAYSTYAYNVYVYYFLWYMWFSFCKVTLFLFLAISHFSLLSINRNSGKVKATHVEIPQIFVTYYVDLV